MIYTKAQREHIRCAFIAAKARLSPTGMVTDSHDRYICHAIMNAAKTSGLSGTRLKTAIYFATEAKLIIESRLDGCFTYETWLKKFHINLVGEDYRYVEAEYLRKAQGARKRWLNSLIQEFAN